MTVITAIKPAPAAPKAFAFKGKNKELRSAALAGVASLAYAEGKSRTDVITQLRLALGSKPSADELEACKLQYVVGRVAQRLGDADGVKGMSVPERITFACQLITAFAAPVKDGTTPRKLRKGQLGRRSVSQHKAIRASEEAWSQLKAELGLGTAQTQAQRNAAKRSPAPHRKNSKAPSHAELVAAPKPTDAKQAMLHITTQAASLLAYANKNAAIIPSDWGASIKRFHNAIAQLAADAK